MTNFVIYNFCLAFMSCHLLAFSSFKCFPVATFFTKLLARFKFSITCSLSLQKDCISICLIVYKSEMHQQDEHHLHIWNFFGNDLNGEVSFLFKVFGCDKTYRSFRNLKCNFVFIVILLFLWFGGYCMCNPCER